MGSEVQLFVKVGEFGFSLFVFYFLPRYSHNTCHWLVLMKHSFINRVIDNLPTGSRFKNKLIIIDPLGLEFENFNNLVR